MADRDTEKREALRRLAELYNCLPSALAANRQGRLTDQQMRVIARWDEGEKANKVVLGLAWIAIVAIAGLATGSNAVGAIKLDARSTALLGLACLPGVGCLLWSLAAGSHRADLALGRVMSSEGTLQRSADNLGGGHGKGRGPLYFDVGDQWFLTWSVPYDGILAKLEGSPCRVYYLPYTSALVNIELLDQVRHSRASSIRARIRGEMYRKSAAGAGLVPSAPDEK